MEQLFDVAIIGGGINGCGCAADASLRGLSVVLLEQDDLASKTSSSSSKLIHGGLRYLEHYEFGLVQKAITERQRLLNLAPHLVHPQAFVLPYQQHMRPAWFLRLGLFIYDRLSRKNRLPKSQPINRKNQGHYFSPLKNNLDSGFLFYDGTADDARLTIANAIQAKNHGASIRTYSTVTHIQIIEGIWQLTVKTSGASEYTIFAKTLINAAGPWIKDIEQLTQITNRQKISLIKGSHIIVPKLYEGEHAYFLQHHDQRVIFVIPYHGFSLIGTTDVPLTDKLNQVHISTEEINYLLSLVNLYFKITLSEKDILYTWSGVRALLANNNKKAQSLTRDYHYQFNLKPAPVITIYGGKITTYRQLAEEVINRLIPIFPKMNPSITATTPLPGATLAEMEFAEYIPYAKAKYQWIDSALFNRYLYTYGTRMEKFLAFSTCELDLGKRYGSDLYQVEIDYLVKEEWARNADDILKRRTKLDITMDEISKKELKIVLNQISSRHHPAPVEPLSH